MSYDASNEDLSRKQEDAYTSSSRNRKTQRSNQRGDDRYRDEIFSLRIPAGKRTYFFDVKSTRSGDDFFLTITESKRVDEGRYEKHKLFLYKEDFAKFLRALHEVIDHIREECLPDYDFEDLPMLREYATERPEMDPDDEEGF